MPCNAEVELPYVIAHIICAQRTVWDSTGVIDRWESQWRATMILLVLASRSSP
jgi:hypothetical protein